MKHATTLLSALLTLAVAGSGCAISAGSGHEATRFYDLGATRLATRNCLQQYRLNVVSSNPVLEGRRMWYRRSAAPNELAPYAISRWVAPPAQLLHSHLAELSATPSAERVELAIQKMELQIDSSGEASGAEVLLILRATRTNPAPNKIAVKEFRLSEPAQISPQGAAHAYTQALQRLPEQLCHWLGNSAGLPVAESVTKSATD